MATIERLWRKRMAGGPMDEVDHLDLVADKGIAGNADQGGWRQVTLLGRERWERARAELGAPDLDPALRRANVLVDGLDLANRRGQVLAIGEARLELRGETRPCRLMDEQHDGLRKALDADWGGGAFAYVRIGGTIRIGDPIEVLTTD